MIDRGQENIISDPFWKWFAETGFNQVVPALQRNTSLEMSPGEKLAAHVILETLDVPEDRLSAPSHRPDEDKFRLIGRLKLSEFANISFQYRPIEPLAGILVAWKGRRLFCLSTEATSDQETDTILHMMAHLALRHINENDLTIRLEGKEVGLDGDLEEEQEAQTWARELRWNHRVLRRGLV